MPRKARIDACLCVSARRQAPGALHHIMARNIDRRSIFEDDTDRTHFLSRVDTILSDTRTVCYEMFNEINRDEVYEDLFCWLNNHL